MGYKRSTQTAGVGMAGKQGSSMKGQATRTMSAGKAPVSGSPARNMGVKASGGSKMDGGKNITVGDSGLSRTSKGRNKL